MDDPQAAHKQVLEEIVNRKKLGDKKFHSETSLQNFGENEEENLSDNSKDPGVLNTSVNGLSNQEDNVDRRRTMSQPGPVSGSLLTATAARAARRRPPRNVMYAPNLERNDSPNRQMRDDEGIVGTPNGERNQPSPLFNNGTLRNGDAKSLNSYRIYAPMNDMRGGTTPRKRSVATMDAQSLRSVETQAPPPTNPEDNRRLTTKYMTLILSGMYAIMLVTLGVIFYLADSFTEYSVASIYSLVLTAMGFGYMLFLLVDIHRYKSAALKNQKIRGLHEEKLSEYYRKHEEEFGTIGSGERTPDSFRSLGIPSPVLEPLKHSYCFSQGRHSGSFTSSWALQGLAHFGFMHMIGSSLCFWISTIVRETVLALTLYANSQYGNTEYGDESRQNSVTVAVYYIIWSNIGHCHNESDNKSDSNSTIEESYSVCKIPTASEENDFTSNMVIYADCHASNRGLFVGLILIVIVIGMLIIGFVFSSVGGDFLGVGSLLNDCTKLGLHVVMLFAAVIAYNQTVKLDINEHPISLLDDVLLFICLPAFFMETAFSMTATISILNVVKTVDVGVMVVQVIIQTSLLVDRLRRCSNSRKLRRTKPGRELLMFLIIANVGMWLINTFSYKSPESLDERYEYYGKVLWSILGHISLPLIMFYRFHSSVCFADIWDSAYKPGSEH